MGQISPVAVREFINRPRDSHVWMKKLKSSELNEMLDDLDFQPASDKVPKLNRHQKVCIVLGIAYKSFAFWLDMGTGKTRIALELIKYWIDQGLFTGALVLVLSEASLITWENEIRDWKIGLPILTLLNSPSQDKWDALAEFEGGLVLATYPGLVRMCCTLKENRTKNAKKKAKKERRLYPNKTKIKKLCQIIGAYISDEVTALGKKSSLQYRVCNQISKYAKAHYELAGRPFGRDPTMLWSQLYLIDRGETLGDTLGLFRAAFFEEKENYFGGTDYKFKKDLRPKLNRILRHRSIQYRYEETGLKIPFINTLEEVSLPGEAQDYYEQFVKQIKRSHAGLSERRNSFIRMRQVSSGFVGFTDDATGERAEIQFADNPKLDRMLELIQQMPRESKFVIFHEFIFSGQMICDALKKLKIKHGWLRGGVKNSRELQDRYDHDPDFGGLVVNHKLGAYSLNLQRGNFCFVFEAPVPVIADEQMRARLRRKGQKRTVFEYDMVCRGTADARILAFHRQGGDLFNALMKDPDKALNGSPYPGRKRGR